MATQAIIRVQQAVKRVAVDGATDAHCSAIARGSGEFALLEHLVAGPLGRQSTAINHRPHIGLRSSLGQDIELFFSSCKVPCKAEQFEEKRAAPGIGRIVTHFGSEHLNRFIQLRRLEKLLNGHKKSPPGCCKNGVGHRKWPGQPCARPGHQSHGSRDCNQTLTFFERSQPALTTPPRLPFSSWGLYSISIFEKLRVTFSVGSESPPEPEFWIDETITSESVTFRYSCCVPPAFRHAKTTLGVCFPVAHASNSFGLALSKYFENRKS